MTLAYVGFVLAALALQLLMGANDGGTLLGSIVATNIIRPVWAVALLFVAIVVALLTIGTAVGTTLGNHIVPLSSIRMEMLYGTVAATVLWVWLTKRLRSPVSISYTFVGSLLGSALAAHLGHLIDPISILEILGGMLVAILASFVLGYGANDAAKALSLLYMASVVQGRSDPRLCATGIPSEQY